MPELTIVNDGPRRCSCSTARNWSAPSRTASSISRSSCRRARRLPLPVSCVEAGRWAHRSRAFAAAGRTHYASGRAMKVEQVSYCMRMSGERRADQGAIWDDIDAKAERMAAPSPTHAAAAMYEQSRAHLDAFQRTLEALPRQVGAVFAINGAIAGLELFDSAGTWRKSMRKIVESYGLDALDRQEERPRARRDPARFLASLGTAAVETFPAVGLGEDLRLRPRTSRVLRWRWTTRSSTRSRS